MVTTLKIEIVACPLCNNEMENHWVDLSFGEDHCYASCSACKESWMDETFAVIRIKELIFCGQCRENIVASKFDTCESCTNENHRFDDMQMDIAAQEPSAAELAWYLEQNISTIDYCPCCGSKEDGNCAFCGADPKTLCVICKEYKASPEDTMAGNHGMCGVCYQLTN